jgi:hypothetical protein
MQYAAERSSAECPFTLDLRRAPDREGVLPPGDPHAGEQQQ